MFIEHIIFYRHLTFLPFCDTFWIRSIIILTNKLISVILMDIRIDTKEKSAFQCTFLKCFFLITI